MGSGNRNVKRSCWNMEKETVETVETIVKCQEINKTCYTSCPSNHNRFVDEDVHILR